MTHARHSSDCPTGSHGRASGRITLIPLLEVTLIPSACQHGFFRCALERKPRFAHHQHTLWVDSMLSVSRSLPLEQTSVELHKAADRGIGLTWAWPVETAALMETVEKTTNEGVHRPMGP